MASDFTWHPEEHAWTREAHVARFMRTRGITSLPELRDASVHCYQWFWDEILRDMGLEWTHRYTQMRDTSRGLPWTRWFVGGEINLTHNCVDRHLREGHADEIALFCAGSGEALRRVSFAELADLVNCCALALRAAGVQPGDVVASVGALGLHASVALLATIKLGARFAPLGGTGRDEAWQHRLRRLGARVVFVAESEAHHAGFHEAAERVVRCETEEWQQFLQSGGCIVPTRNRHAIGQQSALACEVTRADDACLLLFENDERDAAITVHTHAGCLAAMGKDLRYALDVRAGKPVCWLAETGSWTAVWALIGSLLFRAPVVLIDPNQHPRWWRVCADAGVATLGGTASLLRRLSVHAPREARLPGLRVLACACEDGTSAELEWWHVHVGGGQCPVIPLGMAVEVAGCLLHPYPVEPFALGALTAPALGLDLGVFNAEGHATVAGEPGWIVGQQPVPSWTRGLLNDEPAYLERYFRCFPGGWCLPMRATIDGEGRWTLHAGRVSANGGPVAAAALVDK